MSGGAGSIGGGEPWFRTLLQWLKPLELASAAHESSGSSAPETGSSSPLDHGLGLAQHAPAFGARRPDGSVPAGLLHHTQGRWSGDGWDRAAPGFGEGAWTRSPAKPAETEGRPRAQAALEALAAPPADHPMMRHAAEVRRLLAKEKLPTDAAGVRVVVLGEDAAALSWSERDHGAAIARTIAGPIGLAQKAELELLDPQFLVADRPKLSTAEGSARLKRSFEASTGTASYDDTLRAGVDRLEGQIYRTGTELTKLAERLPDDGRTTIASISWGQSPFRVGRDLANAAIAQGNEAPLVKELNARRAKKDLPPLDVTTPRGAGELRGAVIVDLIAATKSGDGKAQLDAAREALAKDVEVARRKEILPIAAAGNEHAGDHAVLDGHDRSAIAGVPGILTVGATEIGDPKVLKDDKVARFSNSGAQLVAPGVALPVASPEVGSAAHDPKKPRGEQQPVEVEGTSFSAPYVASVAALMVKANPDITPDQLEKILTSKAVLKDLRGTERDGGGVLDPVLAVRSAAALKD